MYALNSRGEKKAFYKMAFSLVIPIALQNLINVGVQAADVVMLGKVGEVAISAASLAGQVYFVMTLFFFGLTSGAAVLIAQYWGKNDIKSIEQIFGIAVRFAVVTGVIFSAAALLFSRQLMMLFTNEEEVISQGMVYMRIVAISYIPTAFTMVYLNVMRSIERVLVSTVIYLISLVINIILNAVFIFGLFGLPAMGVKGAAIATTIARFTELVLVLFYSKFKNKIVKIRVKYVFKTDKLLLKDFIKYAIPVTANELLWGTGISAINAVVGHLGSSVVAANSVTAVIKQLAMVVSMGVACAAAVALGKVIGEGKEDYAKVYSKRFMRLTFILGVLGALLIICISPLVKNMMKFNSQTNEYLGQMLMICAGINIFACINATAIVGIFRSGGDTKFGFIIDSCTLWAFAIPLGALAAFYFNLPVFLVYLFLCSDELVRIPFVIYRYKSGKWLNNVTRELN